MLNWYASAIFDLSHHGIALSASATKVKAGRSHFSRIIVLKGGRGFQFRFQTRLEPGVLVSVP